MKKGIISVIFCIIAVFSLAVTANAALTESEKSWLNSTHYGYGLLNTNEKLAYEAIYEGVENESSEISFENDWGITETQLRKIYRYYIFDSPEHCWLMGEKNSFSYSKTIQDSIIISVKPTYNGSKTEMKSKFDGALDDIVGKISGSTKYEKALKAHDLLAELIDYDFDTLEIGKADNYAHRAYGALINNLAVCDGYAYAYQAILNELGIKAITVPGYGIAGSNPGAHAWNMVEFETGQWAYVDVTWDDQFNIKTKPSNRLGIMHYYFGRTDDMIANTTAELENEKDHTIIKEYGGHMGTYDVLPQSVENQSNGLSKYSPLQNVVFTNKASLDINKIAQTIKHYSNGKVSYEFICNDNFDLSDWLTSNNCKNLFDICDKDNITPMAIMTYKYNNYYFFNVTTHTHTGGTANCMQGKICDICGKEYGEKGDHSYGTLVPRVAATTNKTGLKAHYKCSVCGCYFDKDTKEVAYESLIIQPYIPGDINGDGNVNNKDVIMLFNYSINKDLPGVIIDACNPDGEDGGLTNKDIIHLFKYVSKVKVNGENIVLH